jgi:hypothetical protein
MSCHDQKCARKLTLLTATYEYVTHVKLNVRNGDGTTDVYEAKAQEVQRCRQQSVQGEVRGRKLARTTATANALNAILDQLRNNPKGSTPVDLTGY